MQRKREARLSQVRLEVKLNTDSVDGALSTREEASVLLVRVQHQFSQAALTPQIRQRERALPSCFTFIMNERVMPPRSD